MPPESPAIEAIDLTRIYRGGEQRVSGLDDVSLAVHRGQVVAVLREQRAPLAPRGRGEAEPAAPAERLALGDGHDLGPEPGQLGGEETLLPRGAADDHPVDADRGKLSHLVGGERTTRDRDERLRAALGRVA